MKRRNFFKTILAGAVGLVTGKATAEPETYGGSFAPELYRGFMGESEARKEMAIWPPAVENNCCEVGPPYICTITDDKEPIRKDA